MLEMKHLKTFKRHLESVNESFEPKKLAHREEKRKQILSKKSEPFKDMLKHAMQTFNLGDIISIDNYEEDEIQRIWHINVQKIGNTNVEQWLTFAMENEREKGVLVNVLMVYISIGHHRKSSQYSTLGKISYDDKGEILKIKTY